MFYDYRVDIAYLCDIVFICLCFLYFGLEHVFIWFFIESWSFWLLIHKVSSPNDVVTLLCILIHWVDFVVVFRDDFSTICQSFVVIVLSEGVTIRNPKMNPKSKFGCPNTAEECEKSVWGTCMAKGHALATTCGGRVPHGQSTPLVSCATRTPHGVCEVAASNWVIFVPSLNHSNMIFLPSKHNLKKIFKRKFCRILHDFSVLISIITFSYEIKIDWSKN